MARFRSLGSIHSLTAPVGFCTTTSELTHSVGASWALLLSAFPSFLVPRQLLLSVARVPSLEHGLQAQLLLLALCDTYRANILIQWTILDSPRAPLASMVALDLLTDNSFQQTKLKTRVSNKHRFHFSIHNKEFDVFHLIFVSSGQCYFSSRFQLVQKTKPVQFWSFSGAVRVYTWGCCRSWEK